MDYVKLDGGSDNDALVMLILLNSAKAVRRAKWQHEWINWEQHLLKLRHANGFQKRYHMSQRSFNELVDLLNSDVSMNELQAFCSTSINDPITPEMIVGAGLRFLEGEYIKIIAGIFGLSKLSVDRVIKSFLLSVDSKLENKTPAARLQLIEHATGWDSLSKLSWSSWSNGWLVGNN